MWVHYAFVGTYRAVNTVSRGNHSNQADYT